MKKLIIILSILLLSISCSKIEPLEKYRDSGNSIWMIKSL